MENIKDRTNEQKETIEESAKSAMNGIQQLANENQSYWERSMKNTKTFNENITGVKSVSEAVDLQFEFAKSQTQDFIAQMGKVGEIYKGIAAETFKPAQKAMDQGREGMQQ